MDLADSKAAFQKRLKAQPIIKKQNLQSSEPTATPIPQLFNSTVSLNRQVFDIIKVLKAEDRPLDNNDLIRKVAIDVSADPILFDKLVNNERIAYSNGLFVFKPHYNVRTKEDLLKLLQKNQGSVGMDVKELKESFAGVMDIIQELEAESLVLVVRIKDDPKIVYFNDPSLNVKISDEFKTMWSTIDLPPETELPKELEKAGLKPMQIINEKKETGDGPKKKKRKTRFKLTNTHLEGIDLKSV